MLQSCEAIVLHSIKYGETSKIVTVFSKEFGKLTFIAKGARDKKNKFGSTLEPLSHSYFTYYEKPNQDLHLLSKAELLNQKRKIYDSIEHLYSGLLILESINKTQFINEPHDELFENLKKSLIDLNELKFNSFSVFIYFQIQLIKVLGFELDFSMIEFNLNQQKIIFSLEHGKVIDGNENSKKNIFVFDKNLYIYLTELNKFGDSKSIELISDTIFNNEKMKNEIIYFFSSYFSFHLDKHFFYQSYKLIKDLK